MKSLTKPITAKAVKSRNKPYCQCVLRRGNAKEVAFIPKQFAIKGQILKVLRGKMWDDGWLVEDVGSEIDEIVLDGLRSALKNHSKVSDI